ncbi:hypothetical protein [Mycobacteroides chelonae]|uniref:hypothetical protein n=1 Tax=Mycobacteroides chelonae TaxID=1774 RepID=UPI0012FF6966|nr:hypothetical protein [Mycobacteroides chelonae]
MSTTNTICELDHHTVTEAITQYRLSQATITDLGDTLATHSDQLAAAFSIVVDGQTLSDAPTSFAPAVRAEAAAIASQLATLSDELQEWLDGLTVTYDDNWISDLTAHVTAGEAAAAAGDRDAALAHIHAALAVAPADGLANLTSVKVPERLLAADAVVTQRVARLGELNHAMNDASADLRGAADTWEQAAPKATELNTAETGDPELYRDLVARREAAAEEFFSNLRSAAEKVEQAQAA